MLLSLSKYLRFSISSALCSINAAIFLYLSVTPLVNNNLRVSILTTLVVILVILSKGVVRKWSIPMLFQFAAFLMGTVALFLMGLVSKEAITFFAGILWSVSLAVLILDIVGFERLLRVNYLLIVGTIVLGIPVFLLFRLDIINPVNFPTYTYGGYSNHTLYVLNFHKYLDGTISGRYVGFGSEPGLSQLLWFFGLYYALFYIKSIPSIVLIVVVIVLGRSPIGIFSALILLLSSGMQRRLVYSLTLISLPILLLQSDSFIFGINKISIEHLSDRFSRELLILQNWDRYIMPGGIFSMAGSLKDNASFGTLGQFIQRGGWLFLIWFAIVSLLSFFSKRSKNYASAFFLLCVFLSQSVFVTPIFYAFWFKIFFVCGGDTEEQRN